MYNSLSLSLSLSLTLSLSLPLSVMTEYWKLLQRTERCAKYLGLSQFSWL